MTPNKFEVYQDKAGKFRFRFKIDGTVAASGVWAYETKAQARNGIAQVQKCASDAALVDLT